MTATAGAKMYLDDIGSIHLAILNGLALHFVYFSDWRH